MLYFLSKEVRKSAALPLTVTCHLLFERRQAGGSPERPDVNPF